jgi:hypothetical protein
MRPDDSADAFVFFGALLVAAGWFLARRSVRQFRRPVETFEELRRNLDDRGVPRYGQGLFPGDPRPWASFMKAGAAEMVVVAIVIAAVGLVLVGAGLYQIVKWRL